MRDRLIRGGLAGAIGGFLALAVSAPSYFLLHFEKEFWVKSLTSLGQCQADAGQGQATQEGRE